MTQDQIDAVVSYVRDKLDFKAITLIQSPEALLRAYLENPVDTNQAEIVYKDKRKTDIQAQIAKIDSQKIVLEATLNALK